MYTWNKKWFVIFFKVPLIDFYDKNVQYDFNRLTFK